MTPRSRARTRLLPLVLVLLTMSVLGGCGSDEPTARTSVSPRATVSASESPTGSASPTESVSPTESESPAGAGGQVVEVDRYGISFEVPRGWITLDAKKVLEGGGGKNPFLDEMADRLSMTREQLMQSFTNLVQTMSVSDEGAHHGILDNINSVGQDGDLNDDQLKLQLATVGAKLGPPRHATTEAGDVTVISYALASRAGLTIRGVAVAVRTGDATVLISVTSSSNDRADHLAALVLGSLRKIPGSGPNL
jgi:hypothetical protein